MNGINPKFLRLVFFFIGSVAFILIFFFLKLFFRGLIQGPISGIFEVLAGPALLLAIIAFLMLIGIIVQDIMLRRVNKVEIIFVAAVLIGIVILVIFTQLIIPITLNAVTMPKPPDTGRIPHFETVPTTGGIPHFDAFFYNSSTIIIFYNSGRVPLYREQLTILVDGVDRTTSFIGPNPLTRGMSWRYNSTSMPKKAVVIFNGPEGGHILFEEGFPHPGLIPR